MSGNAWTPPLTFRKSSFNVSIGVNYKRSQCRFVRKQTGSYFGVTHEPTGTLQ